LSAWASSWQRPSASAAASSTTPQSQTRSTRVVYRNSATGWAVGASGRAGGRGLSAGESPRAANQSEIGEGESEDRRGYRREYIAAVRVCLALPFLLWPLIVSTPAAKLWYHVALPPHVSPVPALFTPHHSGLPRSSHLCFLPTPPVPRQAQEPLTAISAERLMATNSRGAPLASF